jgi:hypothetical protein
MLARHHDGLHSQDERGCVLTARRAAVAHSAVAAFLILV